jgi:hypothetical protein
MGRVLSLEINTGFILSRTRCARNEQCRESRRDVVIPLASAQSERLVFVAD